MSSRNKLSKDETKDKNAATDLSKENLEEVEVEVEKEHVPQTIRIEFFKTAFATNVGVIKKGTILEIPEDQFENWSNVSIELEE